jgi:hypothetical protein
MDLLAAYTSVKTAGEMARAVARAGTEFKAAEYKMKFADVADALIEAKDALGEAREEIRNLNDKIRQLEQSRILETEVFTACDAVWRDNPLGGDNAPVGPHCVRCWHKDRELIPLIFGSYRHMCPQCKTDRHSYRSVSPRRPDGAFDIREG